MSSIAGFGRPVALMAPQDAAGGGGTTKRKKSTPKAKAPPAPTSYFDISTKGTVTSAEPKNLSYLSLSLDTKNRLRAALSKTVDVTANGSLDISAGSKESPGFTSGTVYYGPISQVSDTKANVVASAKLALAYHPSESGYELSLGGGFKENKFSLNSGYESPNLSSSKNKFRFSATFELVRPIATDAKWTSDADTKLKYKKAEGSADVVTEFEAGIEVQDLTGERNVQATVSSALDLGDKKSLSGKAAYTVVGKTYYSVSLDYKMPVLGPVFIALGGSYEGNKGEIPSSVTYPGVSVTTGEEVKPRPLKGGESALKGNFALEYKNMFGNLSPFIGVGETYAVNAIEAHEEGRKRFEVNAGIKGTF